VASIKNIVKNIAMYAWIKIFGGQGKFKNLLTQTAMLQENALSPDVCKQLIMCIDKILEQKKHLRVWKDNTGSDCRIFGFEHEIGSLISQFKITSKIEEIDKYTGRKTKSWFLMANKVLPKNANLGSGGGLHRDSPFFHQVKCIWYLNDVGEDNGPFRYLHGSNKNLYQTRGEFPLGQTRFTTTDRKFEEVHAKSGTLLVCDTKCIHGGKPIASGVRYAVTLYTLPDSEGPYRQFTGVGLDAAKLLAKSNSEIKLT